MAKQRRLERKFWGISEAKILRFDCVNRFYLQGQCRTQLSLDISNFGSFGDTLISLSFVIRLI